jgi:hypothetical protein
LEFASTSGGIGRLPGVPVFTVDVPVLASVVPGTSISVAAAAMNANAAGVGTPWKDVCGVTDGGRGLSGDCYRGESGGDSRFRSMPPASAPTSRCPPSA